MLVNKSIVRKCMVPFLCTICVLFTFTHYVLFDSRDAPSIRSGSKIDDATLHPTSAHDLLTNNTASCPYYGPEHGLFHPSVEHPRFIITGGAGFIGSHLVKHLRQHQQHKAQQIKVLDNLWRGRLHNLQFENGTWAISIARDFCLVDLRHMEDTLKFVTGADVIFHLADVVAGINYVFSHQSSVFRDNVLINSNTLYAAKRNGIQNFIYVGTACSFPKFLQDGAGIHALRENQTYPAQPESSYGWSKLMGEYEAELAQADDFNIGILRLHNVYGPHSDHTATTGQVIPSLLAKALHAADDRFIVWGSGKQYRDFIYVDDVVESLLLVFERGMNKGVIQVGTAKATTIRELAYAIGRLVETRLQRKLKLAFDNTQPEGDRGRIAVLDRAREILHWQPKVDINEGLAATLSWMTSNYKTPRVLVIIIGQVRGGELAWRSLHRFLLRPFRAHLAVYVSNWQRRTLLHDLAQYVWPAPEYTDWGAVFEMAAKACNDPSVIEQWRSYCKIPGIFMGGVANCSHPASAGILLAFRWLVQQKLRELELLEKYDYFILTRADELYLCDHSNFFKMNEKQVLLPTGEHYGGWSDRHVIAKSANFLKVINLTTELVCRPQYWFATLQQLGGEFNLERIQEVIWARTNVSVSEFRRSMFTVKRDQDPTRWSQGKTHPDVAEFGLKLKYPDEFFAAVKHCQIISVTKALMKIQEEEDMLFD